MYASHGGIGSFQSGGSSSSSSAPAPTQEKRARNELNIGIKKSQHFVSVSYFKIVISTSAPYGVTLQLATTIKPVDNDILRKRFRAAFKSSDTSDTDITTENQARAGDAINDPLPTSSTELVAVQGTEEVSLYEPTCT
jgi:hypothetical protein